MQRFRIGLTGLASVFLLVLIGAAGMGNEAPAAKVSRPEEPLAQMGVAPGYGEQGRTNTTSANNDPDNQPIAIAPPPAPIAAN